jgi:hypothetical protein
LAINQFQLRQKFESLSLTQPDNVDFFTQETNMSIKAKLITNNRSTILSTTSDSSLAPIMSKAIPEPYISPIIACGAAYRYFWLPEIA